MQAMERERSELEKIFDSIHAFLVQKRVDIGQIAKLEGGWEGWLQAELAVHLTNQQPRYDVVREDTVYSDDPEKKELYRRLQGTYFKKSSSVALRADLAVAPRTFHTKERIAIELKCESAGMTRLARLKSQSVQLSATTKAGRERIYHNYLMAAVFSDAMKFLLGFKSEDITKACICLVVTSKTLWHHMQSWLDGAIHKAVDGSNLILCMWCVNVNAVGRCIDDGHAPEIMKDFVANKREILKEMYEDRARALLQGEQDEWEALEQAEEEEEGEGEELDDEMMEVIGKSNAVKAMKLDKAPE